MQASYGAAFPLGAWAGIYTLAPVVAELSVGLPLLPGDAPAYLAVDAGGTAFWTDNYANPGELVPTGLFAAGLLGGVRAGIDLGTNWQVQARLAGAFEYLNLHIQGNDTLSPADHASWVWSAMADLGIVWQLDPAFSLSLSCRYQHRFFVDQSLSTITPMLAANFGL